NDALDRADLAHGGAGISPPAGRRHDEFVTSDFQLLAADADIAAKVEKVGCVGSLHFEGISVDRGAGRRGVLRAEHHRKAHCEEAEAEQSSHFRILISSLKITRAFRATCMVRVLPFHDQPSPWRMKFGPLKKRVESPSA